MREKKGERDEKGGKKCQILQKKVDMWKESKTTAEREKGEEQHQMLSSS